MPATYTNLLYHLVFSTKGRAPLITNALQDDLYAYLGGIIKTKGGVANSIGGIADHVHLLAKLKPVRPLSEIMQHLKGGSSKWVSEDKPGPRKFEWQEGYAAFTVSESKVGDLRRYIQAQGRHHQQKSFREELVALLELHNIEYDPRYLD